MASFDPHRFISTELNPIFYSLESKLESRAIAHVRHENLQLVNDDWRSDLITDLDRRFSELKTSVSTKKPRDMLDWIDSIHSEVQSRGPYYWAEADDFYAQSISTSLIDYFSDSEVSELMSTVKKKFSLYINSLKAEQSELLKDVERLGSEKTKLRSELNDLNDKRIIAAAAYLELKGITSRNKVAKAVDGLVGLIVK